MSKGLGKVERAYLWEFAAKWPDTWVLKTDPDLVRLNRALADRLATEDGRMKRWKKDFVPHGNWTWESYYKAFHRRTVLLSLYHARERLLRAGYLEKEWHGYLREPLKRGTFIGAEFLDQQYDRWENRPGYRFSLTDKGRAWLKDNPKPKHRPGRSRKGG